LFDLFRKGFHCENLKFPRIAAPALTSCLPASLIIASLSLVTESACPTERRASLGSRLGPPLDAKLERERIKKAAPAQHLMAIRQKLHDRACEEESGFVNHISSGSESVV